MPDCIAAGDAYPMGVTGTGMPPFPKKQKRFAFSYNLWYIYFCNVFATFLQRLRLSAVKIR